MSGEVPSLPNPPPATLWRRLPPDLLAFLLGYVVLLPLFLAPLFVTHFLPGLDLPFHLALADMLAQLPSGAGPYPAAYEGSLSFAPYALHYWLLLQLQGLISLNTANKLLMGLYVAALPLAGARLLATSGRSRIPALLFYPLAYNLNFYYGFASFLLSLPLLIFFLAQVADNTDDLHEDDEGAVPLALLRDVVLVVLGVLLFLSHLATFLFGVVAALLLVGFSGAPMIYRIRVTLSLLPGLAAMGWWQASAVGNATPDRPLWIIVNSVLRARMQDLGKLSMNGLLDDLWARLLAYPQHLLTGFRDGSHLDGTLWIAGALLLYFILGVLGIFARGGDRSQGRLVKAGLALMALTLLAYLGLPHHLPKLGMMTVYPRMAVVLALFLPLLVPSWLKRFPRWALPALLLPGVVASGAYGVELTRHFDRYGQEQQDFAAVLEKTPPGARTLGLVFDRESKVVAVSSALVGLPSYYPVERPGLGGLVQQIYCDMDHMPCRTKDSHTLPPAPLPWEPQKLQADKAVPYFTYVLVRSGPRPQELFGNHAGLMEVLAQQGTWTVYKRKEPIVPPAPAAGDKGKPAAVEESKPAPKAGSKVGKAKKPAGKPKRPRRAG